MFKSIISDEKGAALPIVALMLIVLLGFTALTVDAGSLWVVRRTMTTAADAGALAGAKELAISKGLDIVTAKTVARNIAIENGADENNVEVIVENRTITNPDTGNKENRQIIEVKLYSEPVNMTFAKVLGINDQEVFASAIATWGHITEFKKGTLMPIFELEDSFIIGNANLHDGNIIDDELTSESNWGYIDIGSGMSDIKFVLAGNPFYFPMDIGDNLISEPGKGQSLIGSIEDRMKKAVTLGIGSDGSIDIDARRQFMSGIVPVIDSVEFRNLNVEIKGGKEKLKNPLTLPIKYFGVFEILDIVVDNHGNGSPHALDDVTYQKVSTARSGYSEGKGAIIGRFTNTIPYAEVEITPGDQENPVEGAAKYFKLIDVDYIGD